MGTSISSKKYEGVRFKSLSDGDIAYYVRFTKDGKRHEVKVGTKFGGWSEKLAFSKKIELENDFVANSPITFAMVAERYLPAIVFSLLF
ncbi:hypothetical protein [Helicobacter sp. 11S02596-1]|uniref:hypothetical protein n=1 Tax=Helicobacter sp. 11S02596-1 TaxID=1476194 RepID=UPI000BA70542|nr:hypothetical protein [Helicobacter sp. 11S02596-1]PAF41893.1 hypothetical protein BJI48_07465 [Helicobacter sp. 11S02596-1]